MKLELFIFLFLKPLVFRMTVSSSVYFKAGNVGKKYLKKIHFYDRNKEKAIKMLPIKKKIIVIY